jgi:hypothetical protein
MDPFTVGLISAAVQTGGSLVSSNEERKAQARLEQRPKRRKLAGVQEALGKRHDRSQAMLAALAQSHLDYARLF